MNSKNVLLSNKKKEPHIWLTVGHIDERKSTYYGFSNSGLEYGKVNRIPYWGGNASLYFSLYATKNWSSNKAVSTTFYTGSLYDNPHGGINFKIYADTDYWITFLPDEIGESIANNVDILHLIEKDSQTIPVWFDPPPTATSRHRSINASAGGICRC